MVAGGPAISSSDLKVVGSHADLIQVWLWKNVCIFAWTSQVTGASTDALTRIMERAISMVPSGQRVSGIHLVPNRLELPDSAGRKGLVKILNDFAQHFACIAVMLGGVGFWASAVRSFVTGVRVLVPRTFDVHVVATPEELQGWMPAEHRRRTGVSLDSDGLLAAVRECQLWQEQAIRRHTTEAQMMRRSQP